MTSAKKISCALILSSLFVAAPALAKPYKGAEIYTPQAYLYGKMEMRMRMARGSGILSTFFLYKDGSEQSGTFWEEVDIEVFGADNAEIWQSNIITGFDPRQLSEGVHDFGASLADDYHTYTLEWRPGSVRWLLDGVEVRHTTGGQADDLTSPESLRFNIWAATDAGWVGPFDDAVLPVYQYVNWIKYYRLEGDQFVLDWTDEFDTFDSGRWGRADWTFAENRADFAPENAVVRDGILVLALTAEGQTGYDGSPPVDDDAGTGGASGTGGSGSGGDMSTGGDPGVGGEFASGGDPGAGGEFGSGGTPGIGGELGSSGGALGSGGGLVGTGGVMEPAGGGGDPASSSGGVSSAEALGPDSEPGCSCRAAPGGSNPPLAWAFGLALAGLLRSFRGRTTVSSASRKL